MKINRRTKIQSFKFYNNFNIDYSPYYIIKQGQYQFQDKVTMIKFMYNFGIMCKCQRIKTNKGFNYCYNNIEITDRQKDFIKKRAIALQGSFAGLNYVEHKCGCKKDKA